MRRWEDILQTNAIQKVRIRDEIKKLLVRVNASNTMLYCFATLHIYVADASSFQQHFQTVLCCLRLIVSKASVVVNILLQAAELDRAQEFKEATEGLAVSSQRLREYNEAANKLVIEKETREKKLLTVFGMFKKAQELVTTMRDLNLFLTSSIQEVSRTNNNAAPINNAMS